MADLSGNTSYKRRRLSRNAYKFLAGLHIHTEIAHIILAIKTEFEYHLINVT